MSQRTGREYSRTRIDNPREKKRNGPIDMTEFPTEMRQDPDEKTGLGGWLICGRSPEDVWRQYLERKATEENGIKGTNTVVPSSPNLGSYQVSGEPQE